MNAHLIPLPDVPDGDDQESPCAVVAPDSRSRLLRRCVVHLVHQRQHVPDHDVLACLPRKGECVGACRMMSRYIQYYDRLVTRSNQENEHTMLFQSGAFSCQEARCTRRQGAVEGYS